MPLFVQKGIEGGYRKSQTSEPHLDPLECDGTANPGNQHTEGKKMNVSSQHRFIKGKILLINLTAFYGGMPTFVEDGRAVNVIYLAISNTFSDVSHNKVLDNLMWYRLHI